MRTDVSGALAAALDTGSYSAEAELYTLTMKGGAVYRWADCDVDVVAGGQTFTRCGASGAPLIRRNALRMPSKLEIDELDLTLLCGDGDAKIGATPIPQVALANGFDGATLQLDLAYLVGSTWETLSAWFLGTVSTPDPKPTEVRMVVRSYLADLAKPVPRQSYQTQCTWALYSDGCGVAKATHQVAMTVGGGATATSVPATGAQATGWFTGGFVLFTSGVLSGYRASVSGWTTGGTFSFLKPLPAIPAPGDTFTAYPGCDKTLATCTSKFSNANRFRGFPYIPRSTGTTVGRTVPPVTQDRQTSGGGVHAGDDRPPRQAP